MNTTDRQIIKDLLQSLTDRCLFGSEEFRAAQKHFNITTTYSGQQVSDEVAVLLGKEHNHFVDVLYASRIDAHPRGERFWFATRKEAVEFAARERTIGDRPDVQTAIDAAHDEALAMNAEIDLRRWDATVTAERETARAIIAQAIHVGANSSGHVIGEHEELVETLHNAGFLQAAVMVDAIIDGLGGSNHKEIRSNWLAGLRQISASI